MILAEQPDSLFDHGSETEILSPFPGLCGRSVVLIPEICNRPSRADFLIAELQDQIDELESVSAVAGERQEAIDHVLAGISKLQHEVSDAAEFTPSYDRKQYSDVSVGKPLSLLSTVSRTFLYTTLS